MKKFIKPMLLLGTVFGLVGCSANGIIRTVDYATASGLIGKAFREITDFEKMPLNKIHSEIKMQSNIVVNGEHYSTTNDEMMFNYVSTKNVCELSRHMYGDYPGKSNFDETYVQYCLFDDTYGIVFASEDSRGRLFYVEKDIAALHTRMSDDEFEGSIEEWCKMWIYEEVLDVMYELCGYGYLQTFTRPEASYKFDGFIADYSFNFKSDGKVVQGTFAYETLPYDDSSENEYNIVEKQEFSFKLNGLLLTELNCLVTRTYNSIIDDVNDEFVETYNYSLKTNKKVKLVRPNLSDYFLISSD